MLMKHDSFEYEFSIHKVGTLSLKNVIREKQKPAEGFSTVTSKRHGVYFR